MKELGRTILFFSTLFLGIIINVLISIILYDITKNYLYTFIWPIPGSFILFGILKLLFKDDLKGVK